MPALPRSFFIPTAFVRVPERMRKEFTADDYKKLSALEFSIRTYGLLNPILITHDLELVAGHRRLLCHQRLNRELIEAKYFDQSSEHEHLALELEENIRRLPMSWRELMLGIGKYHEQMTKANPQWTARDSSHSLCLPGKTVNTAILIFPFRNHKEIQSCRRLTDAATVARSLKRQLISLELARAV